MVNFPLLLYHKKVIYADSKGVFMKEFFKKLSNNLEDRFIKPFMEGFLAFVKNHPEIFCLSLLAFVCFLFLFVGLDFYPLLDVDETRYAVMSRDLIHSLDWNSLMLNSQPFLEKPPLYFWIVGASIKWFGEFSALAVRLPIAFLASFLVFFTYFIGRKIISRKFGMLSALILLSSIFFLILSHVAIIDMVLTVFMTSAIYCGLLTHFCEDKFKKYCWWYFYAFAGLGFLAKGILAIAIPAVIIFIYNLITKTLKDIFKPVNILPGALIFLVLVLPWHIIMYLQYGNKFIKEYFLLHHFARFINSESIGRERPFWYFIPVFLLGFMPWSFIFIASLTDGVKNLVAKYKAFEGDVKSKLLSLLEAPTNEQKLLLFTWIYFVVVFLVFSSSSTKLPTYILPAFPAAALLTGYFWWFSDEKSENEKTISITTQIFAALFILTAVAGTIVYWTLPIDLQEQLGNFKSTLVYGLDLTGILLLLRLNTKRALSVFSGYIVTMLFVIILGVSYIFNIVYAGGENEIQMYSSMAQEHAAQLVTFDFAVKPSAMIKYKGNVEFLTDEDFNKLDETLKSTSLPIFVIVKNKNLRDPEYVSKIEKRLKFIQSGKKYSLYAKNAENMVNRPRNRNHSKNKKTQKKHAKQIKDSKNAHDFLKKVDGFGEANPFSPPDLNPKK